uniref:Uncharacterized protein n=1 Tax=viral metagenome TaxID=1070528 RepID=A0A6M3K398_9ZZZZ
MNSYDTPIYWYLFKHKPQTLQALSDYQRKHYGCKLEKPEQPMQKPIEIPVNETSEELVRLMQFPPSAEGHNY